MTARQVFEGLLTELSKVDAPSMLLQDFNYFFNKAINQYINKVYNIYDTSQQTTDDLRVLKSSDILIPIKITEKQDKTIDNKQLKDLGAGLSKIYGATYEVNLPLDYLHILSCSCLYKVKKRFKCYNEGNVVQFPAKRLTGDSWSNIMNNFFNRPLPERPYFYINNINQKSDLPTNPISNTTILNNNTTGTDVRSDYINSTSIKQYVLKYKDSNGTTQNGSIDEQYEIDTFTKEHPDCIVTKTASVNETQQGESNFPRTISLEGITNKSVVEREAGVRYGNRSNVRMEIRYGHDDSVFELIGVSIDYIKTPQTIRLTQEEVNLTEDTSQLMEFPDYVCQEIINELTHLVMQNIADPRLQTHIPITQSIAQPQQQQATTQTRKQ